MYVFTPHLSDIQGVMVETFDKEGNGRRWELVVISQQQWQESDCNVFKLPRPWKKKTTILQIVMTPGFNKLIYHSSEFDPQVPVVDAVQQIFNKLLIFSMKMLNSITICTSYIKHKLTLCAKSFQKKVFILFLAWTYWTDSVFFCSCFFRPSAISSSDRTGSKEEGFPLIISCFATAQHSLWI